MLPRILIIKIIDYIKYNFKNSIIWFENLLLVNKEWRDYIVPKIRSIRFNVDKIESHFSKLSNRDGVELSLSLRGNKDIDDYINKWNSLSIDDNITFISIHNSNIIPTIRKAPKLQNLILDKSGRDCNDILQFINSNENIQHLDTLKIIMPPGVDLRLNQQVTSTILQNLKKLELVGGVSIHLFGLDFIVELENLESISVMKYKVSFESIINLLENTKCIDIQLSSLEFTATDQNQKHVDDLLQSITLSKTIKVLDFYYSLPFNVIIDHLVNFLNTTPNLKQLLCGNGFLVSKNLNNNENYVSNLSIVNNTIEIFLFESPVVTMYDTKDNYSIYSLWTVPSNLNELDLTGLPGIPIESLMKYHNKCSELYIYGSDVSSFPIDVVALNLPNLIWFSFDTEKSTDFNAVEFIEKLQMNNHLTYLNLGCQMDCNLMCQLISQNHPTIQTINCFTITNWNLSNIIDSLLSNRNITSVYFLKANSVKTEESSEYIHQIIRLLENNELSNICIEGIAKSIYTQDDMDQFEKTIQLHGHKIVNLVMLPNDNKNITKILNKYLIYLN
ncbi:hypothetical protein DLAC_08419 [Tieghemostelium lacteum]|uniref:Uncharacterized protein n=1 Tax=Tieghemostelium lacteum TaxID=361077 RepID=A0A151ZBX4_TIELA|nr:hypothetical protein DLAC_08419 [Tieghemostelium lacteum]|eukprot:KYQ91452.1 hypothetical protein DLAC_08419 [Tieghemostelium lacteum]